MTNTRPRRAGLEVAVASALTRIAAEFAEAHSTRLVANDRTPAWTERLRIALVTLKVNAPLAVVRAERSCLRPDHRITARRAVHALFDALVAGVTVPPSIRSDIRLNRTFT